SGHEQDVRMRDDSIRVSLNNDRVIPRSMREREFAVWKSLIRRNSRFPALLGMTNSDIVTRAFQRTRTGVDAMKRIMQMTMFPRSLRGWALAIAVGLFAAGSVVAQTPAPDAKSATPPAKAAKPAQKATKKPAVPEFKLILEPRAMDLLKATSAKL